MQFIVKCGLIQICSSQLNQDYTNFLLTWIRLWNSSRILQNFAPELPALLIFILEIPPPPNPPPDYNLARITSYLDIYTDFSQIFQCKLKKNTTKDRADAPWIQSTSNTPIISQINLFYTERKYWSVVCGSRAVDWEPLSQNQRQFFTSYRYFYKGVPTEDNSLKLWVDNKLDYAVL